MDLHPRATNHPGCSKESLSKLLSMEHESILPQDNLLPNSYHSVFKLIEPLLLKPRVYDAYLNDCIVCRGDYEDCIVCPKCGSARYLRNKIPAKKFIYFPLGPKIARLFSLKSISQLILAHPGDLQSDPDLMYDIHDSSAWKKAYSLDGEFKGDKRGLSFAFCTDGVNPFSHNKVVYSMWPMLLTLLNYPRNVRNLFGSIFLLGIIPGNESSEPKSIDPYVAILTDKLLDLSGKTVYDAYKQEYFQLKANVLMHVLDYPGIGKLFNVSGSGAYKGCTWCDIKGIFYVILQSHRHL